MKNSRNIENSLDGGEVSAAMSEKRGRKGWRAIENETMLFKIEKKTRKHFLKYHKQQHPSMWRMVLWGWEKTNQ